MLYLLILLSFAFICATQYFLSIWLIKIGYFYNYAHTFGGFLVFLILYMRLLRFLVASINLPLLNEQQNAVVNFSMVVLLLASFWLNYEMMKVHQKSKNKTEIQK